jgi:hypothetical protein
VVHANGRVDIEGEELRLTVWKHDPDRLPSVRTPGAVRCGSPAVAF